MAVEASRPITVEEYLALLEASPTKLDFIDGRIIDPWAMEEGLPEAMAGGRIRHALIPMNLARALEPTLDERGCLAVTSDVKVRFDEGDEYCFPDLTIVCGEVDDEADSIEEPTLVVEVLSRGTESYDRGTKFERYRKMPSILEIVLIAQNRPSVERFRRHGSVWVYEWAEGLDAQIEILGAPIRLADVYRKVKLKNSDPPGRA